MAGFFDSLYDAGTTICANIYYGAQQALSVPKRLYNLYNDERFKPLFRQMAFYHLAYYGSLASINYLNAFLDDDYQFEDDSVNCKLADLLFTFSYGLAFEVIYSQFVANDNEKNQNTVLPCDTHGPISHLKRSLKVPLYFPVALRISDILMRSNWVFNWSYALFNFSYSNFISK